MFSRNFEDNANQVTPVKKPVHLEETLIKTLTKKEAKIRKVKKEEETMESEKSKESPKKKMMEGKNEGKKRKINGMEIESQNEHYEQKIKTLWNSLNGSYEPKNFLEDLSSDLAHLEFLLSSSPSSQSEVFYSGGTLFIVGLNYLLSNFKLKNNQNEKINEKSDKIEKKEKIIEQRESPEKNEKFQIFGKLANWKKQEKDKDVITEEKNDKHNKQDKSENHEEKNGKLEKNEKHEKQHEKQEKIEKNQDKTEKHQLLKFEEKLQFLEKLHSKAGDLQKSLNIFIKKQFKPELSFLKNEENQKKVNDRTNRTSSNENDRNFRRKLCLNFSKILKEKYELESGYAKEVALEVDSNLRKERGEEEYRENGLRILKLMKVY